MTSRLEESEHKAQSIQTGTSLDIFSPVHPAMGFECECNYLFFYFVFFWHVNSFNIWLRGSFGDEPQPVSASKQSNELYFKHTEAGTSNPAS